MQRTEMQTTEVQRSAARGRTKPARRLSAIAIVCAALVTSMAACSSTAASSSQGPAAVGGGGSDKALSQTSISISGNVNSGLELLYIAQGAGLFRKNGLSNVSIVGLGTQGADQIALVLGGHAQFVNINASLLLHSKSSGSDLVSVLNVRTAGSVAIVVSDSEAAKLHIPSANSTAADVKAQLAALKGSGLTIGVPSETGDNYSDIVGVASPNGLKVGSDIKISSLGGTANLLAAFKSGKVSAFSLTSPQTYVPNTVMIPLYRVDPVSSSTFTQLATTEAYVKAHPDVVQAVVDAYLEAAQEAQTNASGVMTYVSPLYTSGGVSDQALQQQIFKDALPQFGQPAITESLFDNALVLAKDTGSVNVAYGDFVDNTFVDNAIRQLKLPYTTSGG